MINEKLARIQNAVKVNKTQYNSFGKFYYRNAEDIYDAVKPIASGMGAVITMDDDLIEKGGRVFIMATATIADVVDKEDKLTVKAFAELPTEKKGMDQSQITGAASSYARKYALGGLLLLDDNKDADYAPPEAPKVNTQAEKPADSVLRSHTGGAPLYICEDCNKVITAYKGNNGATVTPEEHTAITRKRYGKNLCFDCAVKTKNERTN